ncbi:MAG: AAA family ATPase [Cohaesibacteraceae bacterium]
MPDSPVTLHMVCGKLAAGKSTLAAKLAQADGTVLISEDEWLSTLFGDQMTTLRDYMTYTTKLRGVMGPHIASLLNAGTSVVLDFAANTVEARAWMRGILETTEASHQLHVLDVPDEVCLARLRARNAGGDHPFAATEEQFHQVAAHFARPTPDEGFNLVVHETA